MTHSNSLTQAAIVLNSLPPRQAAQLLSKLDSGDLRRVLDAALALNHVSAEQITECLKQLESETRLVELSKRGAESPKISQAKIEIDHALAVVPPGMAISRESKQPFGFLADAVPTIRGLVLSDEHPRNIAIVLSLFAPSVASQTMSSLDPNLKISVLKRMCELDEIQDAEIAELVYSLRMRYNKLLSSSAGRSAGVDSAAKLLSCSDAATREALLAHVEQSDPDLAKTLQRSVFGVERLCRFTGSDIKTVLKNVDTSLWAPALKNASTELIDKILNNMAESPAQLLSHEIAEIGYVDSIQEDVARRNIVNVVLDLARKGKVNVQNRAAAPLGIFSKSRQTAATSDSV